MKFAPLIDALKTSAREIVAAGVPDASDQMAKSIDEFAATIQPMIVTEPEATDHVTTLARPFGALIKAVDAVDARQFVLMKGGAMPSEGTVLLLKSAVNLVGVALNLMAAEQSAPIENDDDEQAARNEGLGLCKVASEGGDLLLKHSLSEDGMAWIRDPNEAVLEGVSEAAAVLELLGLDPARLEKAFGEEEPGGNEPGGEGGDGEDLGDTDGEGDDNPLYNMAQMGVATMASAGSLLEAGGDELSDEVKQALNQLSEAGALIAVQADQLLQMHAAEGGDGDGDEDGSGAGDQDGDEPGNTTAKKPEDGQAPKPEGSQEPPKAKEAEPASPKSKREKALALAAQSSELIKAARERLSIMSKAAPAAAPEPAAPAAPPPPATPARPANAPATKLVGLTKSQDGGGKSAEEEKDELLEKLAAMPEEKRQQELIKISLRGSLMAPA